MDAWQSNRGPHGDGECHPLNETLPACPPQYLEHPSWDVLGTTRKVNLEVSKQGHSRMCWINPDPDGTSWGIPALLLGYCVSVAMATMFRYFPRDSRLSVRRPLLGQRVVPQGLEC